MIKAIRIVFVIILFLYLFITFLTYQTRLKEHSLLLRAGGRPRLTLHSFFQSQRVNVDLQNMSFHPGV